MDEMVPLTEGVQFDYESGEFYRLSIDNAELLFHEPNGDYIDSEDITCINPCDFVRVDDDAVDDPKGYLRDFLTQITAQGGPVTLSQSQERISIEYAMNQTDL